MQWITVGGVMLFDVHVLHEMIADRYEHILSSEMPSMASQILNKNRSMISS